jgi:hypothetical protein
LIHLNLYINYSLICNWFCASSWWINRVVALFTLSRLSGYC